MLDVSNSVDLSLYPDGTIFDPKDGLRIGGCRLDDVAREFGTPAYVLDEFSLRNRARRYINAFRALHANSHIFFASKSFPSTPVIRVLAEEGCGVDVAAEGELLMALRAGADPARMVFHGNAKSDADVKAAIKANIGYFVIDNFDDVRRIKAFAERPVKALLRVSPSIVAETHKSMATGHDESKFGIPSVQVADAISLIQAEPLIDLRGLHFHIGSQVLKLDQFEAAIEAVARLPRFPVYDLGGGLGERYIRGDHAPSIELYAERVVRAVHKHLGENVEIILEPGRSLIAKSGVSLYRVVTVKCGLRTHVAVDGGMGDNLEVSLYGQKFEPAMVKPGGRMEICDVVGRHCESGDTLAVNAPLNDPQVGDLLVVPVTGAYCFTMANNYNAALKPPVVFCSGGRSRLAVRRETFDDLIARDVLN
ncbi:diaminopimelate decarboxylase [Acidocella sp.]|uniref:diaminopimelate decarboxylase n=1 Tax=Acidocella sp. TaxID=50710 RepID=UPI002626A4AD|nr:diaminopimelate decarboxylase [Acidocella sp.]